MTMLRITLGTILTIIAINAIGGGYYGMAGARHIPVEWLRGSPFHSYFIPSLFLFTVVGGTCAVAGYAVFKNSAYARSLSFASAGILMTWIIVQVAIIGYVSWMQPAIFISAIAILLLGWLLPEKKSNAAQK